MNEKSKSELFKTLESHNTPAITNVVATYPDNPLCLGLYNPWQENWYTNNSIDCVYPELGARAGYVVTCTFSLPDQNFGQLTFLDVVDAMEEVNGPSILVAKQKFPPEIKEKAGLFGGNMTASMKAVGAVGVVTDGPSRDVDEIREMDFQYMMDGATPGHGNFTVSAINVPVSVAGMDVAPGEIVHMDEHGACKFPSDKMEQVCENVQELEKIEQARMSKLEKAESASRVRDIFLEDEAN